MYNDYSDEESKIKFYIMLTCILVVLAANISVFIYQKYLDNQFSVSSKDISFISSQSESISYFNASDYDVESFIETLKQSISNLEEILSDCIISAVCSLITLVVNFIPTYVIINIYKNSYKFPSFGKYEDYVIYIGLTFDYISSLVDFFNSLSDILTIRRIYAEAEAVLLSLTTLLPNISY